MDLELKGKRALVTGGTHGIGLAIACGLAREGCDVAVCSRKQGHISNMQSMIKNLFKVNCISACCDVLYESEIEETIDFIKERWGGVDILINNVGGGGRWGNENVLATDELVWIEVYQKNAGAATQFTMSLLPYMIGNNWGRVVTISSIYGKEGGGRPWFNMAKAAEISLMKTLAMNSDLVKHNITFNSIAPGAIMIFDTGWDNEEEAKSKIKQLPLSRMGTPEEVANVAVFLCSSKASLVNGACITVDGGESRSF
jgi:3-oxoacyl-[acyl-carrier protein] reductase